VDVRDAGRRLGSLTWGPLGLTRRREPRGGES
jgi:hypothetical protein